ncbi:MAG: hypothetical protein A2Z99_18860 [Treponema sp. GWB1_62_6]|nr:MAG: hypothetical protein A2Z99_18860 [Treponema sp. GWB1_62_6]OHE64164.1 MAG: hypothetical protein A2001_11225 [Treponema sp. GWC1_61_84]OHE75043.1 MAG: hypothetical protein A2413_08205 [Treponema sp. RIFOXYC1_FULL_61_9]HCM28936.1 hypothetical protein [Treponema sp.]
MLKVIERNPRAPRYRNPSFHVYQKRLDTVQITRKQYESFLTAFFHDQDKALATFDFIRINPQSITKAILIPRQDLYFFTIYNWIKHIFVPSLEPRIAENLLIFGLGRIFSSYNDTGVQYCTDADLNFVVSDSLTDGDMKSLKDKVDKLREMILEAFNLLIEVNSDFTVQSVRAIHGKMESDDEKLRTATALFYKGNDSSLFVLHDNAELRELVFSRTRSLPDCHLFTLFLGDNVSKSTFTRLRADVTGLSIFSDRTRTIETVRNVIGSKSFSLKCRRLWAIHSELHPGEWYFSMKYMVNRVRDYVSALLWEGYSLAEIGFTGATDPNFLFITKAHTGMLYLQELIYRKLDSFDHATDYTYISSSRFNMFTQIMGEKFYRDFRDIAWGLLLRSQQKKYDMLEERIRANDRGRIISGTHGHIRNVLRMYDGPHELVFQDTYNMKVCLPYTAADLGYFALNTITDRMISILDTIILPSQAKLGMSEQQIEWYREQLRNGFE